ncbi:MAG TPA: mechanosensitive ion channel family protein [Solirubrobacterales bacterium]|nr:mechanosensitive ion channel family protein [Solirubrobacterales bacterium]
MPVHLDLASVGHVVLDQLLGPLLILVGAFLVSRLGRRLVKRAVRRMGSDRVREGLIALRRHTPPALRETREMDTLRSEQRTEAIAAAVAGFFVFVVWIVAIVFCLEAVGVRLGPLLAGAGLLGIALGFGAQSLVRDFLSGFLILVEDQFGVGDWVTVTESSGGQAEGEVEMVTLRATRIRALDGTVWHVPNGQMAAVGNMSQHWSRALVDVRVAYDTDVERARRVMKEAADEVWQRNRDMLEEPQVWGVVSMGPGGLVIRLVAKTKPLEQWRLGRELRERIKARFDAEGISVPPASLALSDTVAAAEAGAVH